MLKPPINNLVEKISTELGPETGKELGNRYSLVLAIAKRARVIASSEEKVKEKEPATFESRISDKYKSGKETIKPIHKAIDELYGDEIVAYRKTIEEMKADTKDIHNEESKPVEIINFTEADDEE
ncbi:MAG: DNA-directed RNA polymerase subunit omega [Clostridia bacterium]|nr:DNA-directed RNA polymerase subunit omega [Clostridia bacterium]